MRIAKLKSAYNSLVIGTRGFGALSLRWIQFASVLRCARSSFFIRIQLHVIDTVMFLIIYIKITGMKRQNKCKDDIMLTEVEHNQDILYKQRSVIHASELESKCQTYSDL